MTTRTFTSLFAVLCLLSLPVSAAESSDEQAVKAAVMGFLSALGQGDYEAVPAMFAAKATISHPHQVDGRSTMINETFEAWFAPRLAAKTRNRFREPVNHFDVHVDLGLAFVRADADFFVGDQLKSNNLDYFTLIKVDGAWKFVNASFVSKPVPGK